MATCPMCGHGEETLYHCLNTCDHARLFWEEAERFFGVKLPKLHPETWTKDMLDVSIVTKDTAAILVTVMWAIWHSRNKYTHGENKFRPRQSMILIAEIVRALEIPETVR